MKRINTIKWRNPRLAGKTGLSILFSLLYFVSAPLAQAQTTVDLKEQYGFGWITSLSQGLGFLIQPAITIAATAVLIYFIVAAFKLVFSAGDKNAVAEARGMITHAIIGLLLLFFMFVIFQFIPDFFGLNFRIISLPGSK